MRDSAGIFALDFLFRFRLAPNGEEKALIGHVFGFARIRVYGRPFRVAAHSCVPPTGRARRIETDAGRSARAEGTRRPVACPSNGACVARPITSRRVREARAEGF